MQDGGKGHSGGLQQQSFPGAGSSQHGRHVPTRGFAGAGGAKLEAVTNAAGNIVSSWLANCGDAGRLCSSHAREAMSRIARKIVSETFLNCEN